MSEIEKLTLEQEKQIAIYREKWLNKVFNYELNQKNLFESVKTQMKDLYKFCNLNDPLVLFVDSPLACQIAANMFQEKKEVWAQVGDQVGAQVWDQVGAQVRAQVGAQVGAQVRAQVGAQVGAQVWAQVWDQVGDQVWDQVRDQVWDQVRHQVRAQVGAQVWDQVGAQVWDQVRDQVGAQVWDQVGAQVWDQVGAQVWAQVKMTFYTFSSYVNCSDFGALSFYEFMDEALNLNLNKDIKKWIQWTQSSFMSIQLEGLCIVSNFPSFISRNENNDLHNIERYAIEFNDGYGINYINGKYLPLEVFNNIKNNTYKLESFLKEQNEEIKSAAIEMMQLLYGDAILVRFFGDNLKEVDIFIDKKEQKYLEGTTGGMNIGVYTLFKGNINGNDIGYIQCYCPSTDRMFFLGVEPHHTNAKDAIASLYRVPKKLVNNIKAIQRQGEIYSTIFDTKGLENLKNMSEQEISDQIGISGELYFNKLTYEY